MDFDLGKINAASEMLTLDDYRVEAMLALGGNLAGEGLAIPQPTLGCLPLFEAIDSPFLCARAFAPADLAIAAAILCLREVAVGLVLDSLLSGSQDALSKSAWAYLASIDATPDQVRAAEPTIRKYRDYIYNGFAMLPDKGGVQAVAKMRCNAEWIARVCVRLHAATGASSQEILWQMPLTFAGFATAVKVEDAGDAIARPRDWNAVKAETERQVREIQACRT